MIHFWFFSLSHHLSSASIPRALAAAASHRARLLPLNPVAVGASKAKAAPKCVDPSPTTTPSVAILLLSGRSDLREAEGAVVEIPTPVDASAIAARATGYAAMLATMLGSSTSSSSAPLGAPAQGAVLVRRWACLGYGGGRRWGMLGEKRRGAEISLSIAGDCGRGVRSGCLQDHGGLTPGKIFARIDWNRGRVAAGARRWWLADAWRDEMGQGGGQQDGGRKGRCGRSKILDGGGRSQSCGLKKKITWHTTWDHLGRNGWMLFIARSKSVRRVHSTVARATARIWVLNFNQLKRKI
jgi:hypothetical protein